MPIPDALVRSSSVLVTTAATVATATLPAAHTEAEARRRQPKRRAKAETRQIASVWTRTEPSSSP